MLPTIRLLFAARTGLAIVVILVIGLLVPTTGCSKKRRSAEHVEVTGEVVYNGSPLPGGRISFITTDGFEGAGVIDENGKYKVNAPVGECQISVDNRSLKPKTEVIAKAGGKGAGRPREAGGKEPEQLKGKYVRIPEKYYTPTTSGLTYTVTKEKGQTKKVELTD